MIDDQVQHLSCPCNQVWIGDVLPDPCPYHPFRPSGFDFKPWPMAPTKWQWNPLQLETILSDEDVERIAKRVAELLKPYL